MPNDRSSHRRPSSENAGLGSSSTPQHDEVTAVIEDYLTRRDRGEQPDIPTILSQHPQHALELGRFFENLQFLSDRWSQEKKALVATGLGRWFRDPDSASGTPIQAPPEAERDLHVGRFRILEQIGNGSQGVIHKAEQLGTKRLVALKVIRDGALASMDERWRFENEVYLASRLKHPNIVSVFECGQDRGRDYFAMEYVEGVPLDVHLDATTLSVEETVLLFLQIAEAVSYAHQRGIIHRDLKPGNILVDRQGQVHILDFGLAKPITDDPLLDGRRLTLVGGFTGTWYYASPEQVNGNSSNVDVRSDVYTLGLVLFEMLTDALPYPLEGKTRPQMAEQITSTSPFRPSQARSEIDDELDEIVLQALRKEPERRYQSADALVTDLRRYLRGEVIDAKRDSAWYVIRRTLTHYRKYVVAAVASVVVLLAFAITTTILYARADAARATIEARATLARNTDRYVLERLDDFRFSANTLDGLLQSPANPVILSRLQKESELAASVLPPAPAVDMLRILEELIRGNDPSNLETATSRVNELSLQLAEVRALTTRFRLKFATDDLATEDWIGTYTGKDQGLGSGMQFGAALLAQAWIGHRLGEEGVSLANLSAARSLALDIGDSRSILENDCASLLRQWTHEVIQSLLMENFDRPAVVQPYINWILQDPPNASRRSGLISERQKIAQYLSSATMARKSSSPCYLDLNRLDQLAGGAYARLGALSEQNVRIARQLDPTTLFSELDAIIKEMESWQGLPLPLLNQRVTDHEAWSKDLDCHQLLYPLLPDARNGFRFDLQAASQRAATLLAAHFVAHHLRTGQWPETPMDCLTSNDAGLLIDPLLGVPFGYHLTETGPFLYSLNEDGEDNAGRRGEWGAPATDFVFFPSANRHP